MNITGSFETQAVEPKWFAELSMEIEGAFKRLEFDTDGQLNLASAPGAKISCLRLVSGRHLAPGSRYNVISLDWFWSIFGRTEPTPVDDLEIGQWNARNIEIALKKLTHTHCWKLNEAPDMEFVS